MSNDLGSELLRQAKRLRADVARKDKGEQFITHIPTGFRELDETYGGVRRRVATALVAHTGVGKSSFARQVIEGAAKSGAGCLVFFGEDPEDAMSERWLADDTGITATEMGRLYLTQAELDRIAQAAELASTWASRVQPV